MLHPSRGVITPPIVVVYWVCFSWEKALPCATAAAMPSAGADPVTSVVYTLEPSGLYGVMKGIAWKG